jgi:hypothetical protein
VLSATLCMHSLHVYDKPRNNHSNSCHDALVGLVIGGRRVNVSGSNLSEAIVAENEKKERLEKEKREAKGPPVGKALYAGSYVLGPQCCSVCYGCSRTKHYPVRSAHACPCATLPNCVQRPDLLSPSHSPCVAQRLRTTQGRANPGCSLGCRGARFGSDS